MMTHKPVGAVAAQQTVVTPVTLPPPGRFRCVLDEQPGFLVPARLLPGLLDPAKLDRLIVNPHCWFSWCGPPPAEVIASEPLTENFDLSADTVIVADHVRKGLLPYTFGSGYRALAQHLRPGEPTPKWLPPEMIGVLKAAHVLILTEEEQTRRETRDRTLALCSDKFRRTGYAPIAGLLHPFHLGALRRYYRYLIRNGSLTLGDGQSASRFCAHNESAARFFHHQLTPVISAIAGEALKPSYVYLASYLGGAELPRHTDRPQCEFSVTLLVDCTPEPEVESPWPIHLDTQWGRATVYQAIGDGLLYRGRTLPHLREPQPRECTSTSLFFHYVAHDFNGQLH